VPTQRIPALSRSTDVGGAPPSYPAVLPAPQNSRSKGMHEARAADSAADLWPNYPLLWERHC
jgi:hypothetical protein